MSKAVHRFGPLVFCLFCLSVLSGCAANPYSKDPFEPFNRTMFKFNEGLDTVLIKPVAEGYSFALPKPVRTAITNFFSNVGDIFIGINNLLQGKIGRAASDAGRFLANSTIGLLGFLDVATKMGLPKHNEDFGQTLGKWGIGPGPYLVLPVIGASSFRDAAGVAADLRVDPLLNIEDVAVRNTLTVVRIENARANTLDVSKVIEEAALDRYAFVRDAYLQRRRNLVYDGEPPPETEIEEELSPEEIQKLFLQTLDEQTRLTDG